MTAEVVEVAPTALVPVFADLYGAPEDAVAWMADACTAGWLARHAGPAGEVLGAVGLRPSPQHGAELVGGVVAGPQQAAVAVALARSAHAAAGRVYVFAEGFLFPSEALLADGFQEVGAYRRLAGRVPYRLVEGPPDVRLFPLSQVPEAGPRLQALRTYEDRIGHHAVAPEAAQDGAGGFDADLSVIALDAQGRGIGICRAAAEDGVARLDSPGVAAEWRATALRAALLSAVFGRLRSAGITQLGMDSWGDTPEELAHDLHLGLGVSDETPILALG
ncbi:hypothetical protein [Deinococcus aerophilus]|uniref:N-acetyltransferase domain-containing protein n=1 Tax=Deinococcus aerophilus TaxID=522488 RepID=A0ABQ2GKW3_9DEIO|nr:hypothetical protein [Deinococcus aerophilus]GGM01048.1 hypothetical protein GCM10010841_06960 [Deinococcus aerophilus]